MNKQQVKEIEIMTKKEHALAQWNEQLRKAEERLLNSIKCYEKFHDTSSLEMVEEDKVNVENIKKCIAKIENY